MNIRPTIMTVLAAVGIVLCAVPERPAQAQSGQAPHERAWLAAHNAERTQFGVEPLRWNSRLAREANGWAIRLANEGVLRHASVQERGGRGENLWMGTAGYYTADQMIGHFASEKQYFRPGPFPNVSSTGNWADVGHYTQIVWAETREVGCSAVSNARFEVLVCRYWPAGNIRGTVIAPQ